MPLPESAPFLGASQMSAAKQWALKRAAAVKKAEALREQRRAAAAAQAAAQAAQDEKRRRRAAAASHGHHRVAAATRGERARVGVAGPAADDASAVLQRLATRRRSAVA